MVQHQVVLMCRKLTRMQSGVNLRLCRKVAFWRQNPKMGSRKINDLGASTFLFSVICDRALGGDEL